MEGCATCSVSQAPYALKTLVIAPAADRDLIEIYDYTADTWGLAQADLYLDAMYARIDGLLTGRTVSGGAFQIRPGLRQTLVGRHVVFFRDNAEVVTVVRVLHQRMDVQGQVVE